MCIAKQTHYKTKNYIVENISKYSLYELSNYINCIFYFCYYQS